MRIHITTQDETLNRYRCDACNAPHIYIEEPTEDGESYLISSTPLLI